MDHYKDIRKSKHENWIKRNSGIAYLDKFEKNTNCISAVALEENSENINLAGRIVLFRKMGKIAFLKLKDFSGLFQVVLDKEVLGEDFDFFCDNLDLGDIIGVKGTIFITKKGEKSLKAQSVELLSKNYIPLPEKWHGLTDKEARLRKRYVDLIVNDESANVFKFRSDFIKNLRRFMESYDFVEVETPILQAQASGALANPFKTHHNDMHMDLFLRIAPETYLKRLMAGGYERIFEIGKSFRNEGSDPSHLQEFTMMEFYCAYWNFEDAINFVKNVFSDLIEKLNIPETIEYAGQKINLSMPWKVISYKDLFKQYTKLDLDYLLKNEEEFFEVAKSFVDVSKYKSIPSLIDGIYKKHCRPNLIDPCIITHQPSALGPLARVSDSDPLYSDRFQLVINGWEVVNAYSELINFEAQRKTLEKQQDLRDKGEEESMEMEEDFLEAMEFGMPPMAGVGIGIDRLIALFTNSESLREVVFFPNLK